MPGFKGDVTLVSLSGELRTMYLFGRIRSCGRPMWADVVRDRIERDKELYRLLSQGWKVAGQNGQAKATNEPEEGKAGEEEEKQTDVVVGTTKSGSASHGGDHASREVKDSPNA